MSIDCFLSLHNLLMIIPITVLEKQMEHEYRINIIGECINYGTSTK